MLSGSALQFGVFADPAVILIGVAYIIARSLGKYFGAHWSAILAKSPETVKKYLGITLLPQAGVALGMCATAYRVLGGAEGTLIRNIVLFSVLIYELAVIKQFAEPLLLNVRTNEPEYYEAKRLIKFLDYFVGIDPTPVPGNSLCREFVGGGIFPV